MSRIKAEIEGQLLPLIGLKLSIARRAADMRVFHFGDVTVEEDDEGTYGEFALHIQCSWRVEGPDGIVTGRSDFWEPADPSVHVDFDWKPWTDEQEDLQDHRIGAWLGGVDEKTNSFVNATDHLVVEAVEADDFGGARLFLSGGYRIAFFPAGSTGEDWRLFEPASAGPHFVIAGGVVEEDEEDAPQVL